MPKGKKISIKEIKLLPNDEIMINGNKYVILETCSDIQSAKIMKTSSNGNRILRFDDVNKKARIDVKRDIDIIKCTFKDTGRANMFRKNKDKSAISNHDIKEIIACANSYVKAREIMDSFKDPKSKNYDALAGKTNFYFTDE